MNIYFENKNPQDVVDEIKASLGGRKLGDILDIALEGEDICVTISKVGKSKLKFSHSTIQNGGHKWVLSHEKIAFTHKVFREEIIKKLDKIISNLGGSLSQ